MTTFVKTVLKAGTGSKTPAVGASVTVHADLYLRDASAPEDKGVAIWSTTKPSGFLFPASNGPQPFTYNSGMGKVIRGWDDGVGTMVVGERARLVIPWKYGYGENGFDSFRIPPKTDLVFEIEVLTIA